MSKRKLVAAAIALICLLSVAFPALAVIGFPEYKPEPADVIYDVIGLKSDAGIFQAGAGENYVTYDQSMGVTEGSAVTFMLIFKIPRQSHAEAQKLLDGNSIYVEASNIKANVGASCVAYTLNADGTASLLSTADPAAISQDDFSLLPTPLDRDLSTKLTWKAESDISITDIERRDLTLFVLFKGYSIDEWANATISAGWRSSSGKLSEGGSLFVKSNDKDYLVCHSKSTRSIYGSRLTALNSKTNHVFDILIQSGNNKGTAVVFFCRDKDGANYEVLDIAIDTTFASKLDSLTGRTYQVAFALDGTVDFSPYGAGLGYLTPSHANYPIINSALDEVFAVFGWSYDGSLGILNDEGFSNYSGARTWIYYAITERLSLPKVAEIPDTGSAPLWLPALPCAALAAAAIVLIRKRTRIK